MNTRYSFICWLCCFTLFFWMGGSAQSKSAFQDDYPNECASAVSFFKDQNNLFERAAVRTGLSSRFLFSIIAPELTQYNYLSDKVETYSLVIFYVQGGKSYADFSIGHFQMKPSFIEKLEAFASADTKLANKYKTCLFQNPTDRAARVSRIDQLKTIEGQLTYLSLFCDVMQTRFNTISFTNEEEKLRFYASAYNGGFDKSVAAIKAIGTRAYFPHFSKQKFRYADVAVWFYKQPL